MKTKEQQSAQILRKFLEIFGAENVYFIGNPENIDFSRFKGKKIILLISERIYPRDQEELKAKLVKVKANLDVYSTNMLDSEECVIGVIR
ncbi:hypothetical protein [Acidianus sp. RZ1]|uniref:hypothetical protein n=1 Tax=Acidianus sp. RZ1 TaxID=1540082 RepID=UPI00149271D9|nr:hypothetical protein [Acidianus sp. RZ1]NON61558.1 hypothetical protein [Acidianus sp. RZ1]